MLPDTNIIAAHGGSGATTLAVALGVLTGAHVTAPTENARADIAATAGTTGTDGTTFGTRDNPPTITDHGNTRPDLTEPSQVLITVRGPSYVGLRRALEALTAYPNARVVLIEEPGRALTADDATAVLDVPIITIPHDPAIARAADAGLIAVRLPRTLTRALAPLTLAHITDNPEEH